LPAGDCLAGGLAFLVALVALVPLALDGGDDLASGDCLASLSDGPAFWDAAWPP